VGDQVSVFHNRSRVIAPQTISDAGIVGNTRHGLFSTHESVEFSSCEIWAVGTGGEYQILETLTTP